MGVVRSELESLAETMAQLAGSRRRTRIVSSEDAPEFDPEAYITRENTNVVLSPGRVDQEGWPGLPRWKQPGFAKMKRHFSGAGSTLDPVLFLARGWNRLHIPDERSSAQFRVRRADREVFQNRRSSSHHRALDCDPRFTPPSPEDEAVSLEKGPWVFALTRQG